MKIKVKLTAEELGALGLMICNHTKIDPRMSTSMKLMKITLAELFLRISKRIMLVTSVDATIFSFTLSECYALSALLPMIDIPQEQVLCETVRYKVLTTIQPKLV